MQWRIKAQRQVAHGAVQRDWWAALLRATDGRWQPAATPAAGGAQATPLTLLIDGAVQGSFRFEPQAVLWFDAAGVAWRAPVAAETVRAWQEALARW